MLVSNIFSQLFWTHQAQRCQGVLAVRQPAQTTLSMTFFLFLLFWQAGGGKKTKKYLWLKKDWLGKETKNTKITYSTNVLIQEKFKKSFESTDHMEDFQWTLESMQRSPAWQHLWDSQMQNTGQALVDYQTMKSLDLRFLVHQIHFLFQLNKNTSCLHKSCCTGSFIQTLCPQASQCPATNTRLTKQLIEKKMFFNVMKQACFNLQNIAIYIMWTSVLNSYFM